MAVRGRTYAMVAAAFTVGTVLLLDGITASSEQRASGSSTETFIPHRFAPGDLDTPPGPSGLSLTGPPSPTIAGGAPQPSPTAPAAKKPSAAPAPTQKPE